MGQLVVTPEVVVSKINNMKENKSPGVDGISPKILKETVEQISTPLAHVFNMSLQEETVPFEWKEANMIPLFKKGSRNKSVNNRPVSLTSVICKLYWLLKLYFQTGYRGLFALSYRNPIS